MIEFFHLNIISMTFYKNIIIYFNTIRKKSVSDLNRIMKILKLYVITISLYGKDIFITLESLFCFNMDFK